MKLMIGIIVGVVAFIGLVILLGDDEAIDTTSNNRWGESAHNVVITEALDFGCPACAQFHPIIEEYRSEYGDRVVFEARHFPIRSAHPNALAAHRAAEAAARQGKFWEMHDLLFEGRQHWVASTTDNPVPQLDIFAEELGLDIDRFRLDYASSEINSIINNDIKLMKEMGVSATPSFFLNNEIIDNQVVVNAEEFRKLLNQALGVAETDPHSHTGEEADHTH